MKRLRHPVRAIREPFGTAGLIVAIVALIAAVGGTAFAAAKLNSTQKKEVGKIAKKEAEKYANSNPGAPGAPGAKGDAGAPGANGSNGAPGTSATTATFAGVKGSCTEGGIEVKSASPTVNVCNGKKGADGLTGFTKTLPSGETETGTWTIAQAATLSMGTFASVSFSIPLAAPIAEGSAFGFNQKDTEEEKFGTSGCTGTVAKPTAPKGKLCVYTAFESFEHASGGFIEPRSFEGGFGAASVSGALLSGAFLEGTTAEPAHVESWGTWAVTAP